MNRHLLITSLALLLSVASASFTRAETWVEAGSAHHGTQSISVDMETLVKSKTGFRVSARITSTDPGSGRLVVADLDCGSEVIRLSDALSATSSSVTLTCDQDTVCSAVKRTLCQ